MARYCKVCQGVSKCVKVCQVVSRFMKVLQDMSRCVKVFRESLDWDSTVNMTSALKNRGWIGFVLCTSCAKAGLNTVLCTVT